MDFQDRPLHWGASAHYPGARLCRRPAAAASAKLDGWNASDAVEIFNVLRLVLRTQLRSNSVASGAVSESLVAHFLCVQKLTDVVYSAFMPIPNEQPKPAASQEWFATTHWSVVLAAGDSASPQIADALEQLCRTYWYPLYAFIRRSGHDEETAKDLTQSFFQRFLEKNYLKDVNRSRGRFRSFLLASVKHFLANEWDRQHSQRRGGGLEIISLDARLIETAEGQDQSLSMSPEKIFERRWAMALLDTVKQRLAKEFAEADKGPVFDALQAYLSGGRGETPYAEVAAQLGMSVDAVKKSVERLRRRYGKLLREEIARTVAHPSEIDDEIRCLRAALQS